MNEGDWGPGDPLLNPDDPEAKAREQRRRERDARRRERDAQRPPRPEKPGATASGDPGADTPQNVPPPEQRLPSAPAREPFANRVRAMRGRLAKPRSEPQSTPPPPRQDPPQKGPPQKGPPRGAGAVQAVVSNWPRVVVIAAVVVLLWFLIALFQPFHGSGSGKVTVSVPKGSSVSEVGDLLDGAGVVSSSSLFQLRVTLAGKRSDLLPGTYTLHHDESYGDAIHDLTTPPQKRGIVTVTIPEGLSRPQIAPLAKQAGLTGSYVKDSVRSKYLNPSKYGAQGRARNLEGFLFPDTFQVKSGTPASNLVQLQLQDFARRIKGVKMKYARSKNLTTYDILIIASMIEREAQLDKERPLVAAVIYNRLHRGMPLGIDATTRFAVGNYTQPLTESQLNSPSPYNTRLHAGLPPGPIGNPGLASIEAAAHPAKVNYLYYVVKPGTCGEHNFSSSAAQFDRDQAAYQRALQAKGGSPTNCPD
jgi:UPF0755 protein